MEYIAKKKKIMFVISDLESGGTQRVLVNLSNNLIKKNYSVTILLLSNKKSFYTINPQIQIVNLNQLKVSENIPGKILNNLNRIKKIRSIIKQSTPDCVVSFLFQTNVLSLIANIGLKIKIIVSERNNPFYQIPRMYWKILRYITYSFSDHIVVNNHFALEYFKKIYNKKVLMINNSLTSFTRKRIKRKNIILLVSRHHPQKNIKLFINAFSLIHKRINNWKVIIIGSGVLVNQHKELTKKLKFQEKFSWISESKNVSEYYEKSKIFCLPSIFEGVSNALLEAINFDLNCVVSDSAISDKDYVNNFITKFINRSETDLAEKLYETVKNYKNNVIRNKKKYLCNFNQKKIINDWERIF